MYLLERLVDYILICTIWLTYFTDVFYFKATFVCNNDGWIGLFVLI